MASCAALALIIASLRFPGGGAEECRGPGLTAGDECDASAHLQVRHARKAAIHAHHHGHPSKPNTRGLRVPLDVFLEDYGRTARRTKEFVGLRLLELGSWDTAPPDDDEDSNDTDVGGEESRGVCDQGDASSLLPFEAWAIRDFPEEGTSTWGHMCFNTTQGEDDGEAQALFILGTKALSNFDYDYCKYNFDKLIKNKPSFVMGYWGRAMCETQLLWNSENPKVSNEFLKKGRERQDDHKIQLSEREEMYYRAAEALNDYTGEWRNCADGVIESQPCRFKAFNDACEALMMAYPEDGNAGAYVVLSRLALGTVVCYTSAPGLCLPADDARSLAEQLMENSSYKTNPAFLHYSLHSFDYPYEEIYTRGLPFAELYPKLVNGSVHSLHMPSHIYQRNGNFSAAAVSDHASVLAADVFAATGALGYAGWAYNAGNIYHSLEYEQYEVLQACNFDLAALLAERMGVACMQGLAAAGGRTAEAHDGEEAAMGEALFRTTTFYGWLYRMQARLSQQATFTGLLGHVGEAAEPMPLPGWGGVVTMATDLPLPLAWEGTTDYSNAVYAPQSEAGLWNAIALNSVFGMGRAERVLRHAVQGAGGAEVLRVLAPNFTLDGLSMELHSAFPWEAACGGGIKGELSSASCVILMARQRIHEVQQFYLSPGTWYEANLTAALELQVTSSAALSASNLTLALSLGKKAADLEWAAVSALLPNSTSLYFVPGTASYGILALRVAEMADTLEEEGGGKDKGLGADAIAALLREARAALEKCLSPQGRPNLSLCLLGAARVERLMKSRGLEDESTESRAKAFYERLMQNWNVGGEKYAAQEGCSTAWTEAKDFLSA